MVLPHRRTLKIVASDTIIFRVSCSHAGARRGAYIRPTSIRVEPMQRLAGDGFGHSVGAIELPVAYLVTCVIELRDDPSTAALDREHPVARSVRDEDGRLAAAARRRHEPRREGDQVREEVPVGQA